MFKRKSVEEVEEGNKLNSKFDNTGLYNGNNRCSSGVLLMLLAEPRSSQAHIEKMKLIITVEVENVFGTKVQQADLFKS